MPNNVPSESRVEGINQVDGNGVKATKVSTPDLNRSGKLPSSGLRSTTRHGDTPARAGPVGGPSRLVGCVGSHGASGALSLSGGM